MGDAGDPPELWLAIIKFSRILLSPRSIYCKVSLLQLIKLRGNSPDFWVKMVKTHPVDVSFEPSRQAIDLWWFGD